MTYYSTEAVTAYLITALVLVLVTALVTLAILLKLKMNSRIISDLNRIVVDRITIESNLPILLFYSQQNDRLIEKQRVSDVKNAIWNHVSTQV